jgi:DNA-binding NarL/FixJ family response regulator
MANESARRDTILVVDDTPETLGLLTDTLDHAGFTVLIAMDGNSALELLDQITPDLVLMDAVMPGMSGFESCRRIKQEKMLANLPVIFLTGLSESAHVIEGLAAGGVDYVTKPIVPDELLARIRVHLANARISQSARTALDASGRFLLAANHAGKILWSTPQATRLLDAIFPDFHSKAYTLPPHVQEWLRLSLDRKPVTLAESIGLDVPDQPLKLKLSIISQIGSDEILLRLIEGDPNDDQALLRNKLNLTLREAEVLLWIARGKSNRDIADILKLSPRTVNKHLEQIFNKIGVENRASAAALAVRALGAR